MLAIQISVFAELLMPSILTPMIWLEEHDYRLRKTFL